MKILLFIKWWFIKTRFFWAFIGVVSLILGITTIIGWFISDFEKAFLGLVYVGLGIAIACY